MTEPKVYVAKKIEGAPKNPGKAEKAGSIPNFEVEGQSAWMNPVCPWCGAVNRVPMDAGPYDAYTCAWCGNYFG